MCHLRPALKRLLLECAAFPLPPFSSVHQKTLSPKTRNVKFLAPQHISLSLHPGCFLNLFAVAEKQIEV